MSGSESRTTGSTQRNTADAKRKLNKLKDERLQLYAEENKALRQLIMQLREQIH